MPQSENDRHESGNGKLPRLRPKRVTVSIQTEQNRLSEFLSSDCSTIFLDTNILIWSFALNERASAAWQRWLRSLGRQLVIPAWVVHEYNQHANRPEVANPYKALPHKLSTVLEEMSDCASRGLDDAAAIALGCSNMVELELRLREASAFSLRVAKAVAQSDRGHRTELLKFYENLLDERTHTVDIHELSLQADREFKARSALRLSPGGEDATKSENRCGDLIIWKEILHRCAATEQSQAVFISNDVKRDWCYAPQKLVLDGGKEISWSPDAAQDLRLPNPELLAEFEARTGGGEIVFATVDQVIETLASTEHNPLEAVQFRDLSQALRSRRSPTDQVVDWIHGSQDVYNNGLYGAASWQFSPGEVDMDVFEAWCRDQLKVTTIPLDKVDWAQVFTALYI